MFYSVIPPADSAGPEERLTRRHFMGCTLQCDGTGRIRLVESSDPAVYLQMLTRCPCSRVSPGDPAGPGYGRQ